MTECSVIGSGVTACNASAPRSDHSRWWSLISPDPSREVVTWIIGQQTQCGGGCASLTEEPWAPGLRL